MTDPQQLDPTGSAVSGRIEPQAEWLRQIAEHIRDVFWLTEPYSLRIHYISPAFESIWVRTPESLYKDPASFLDAVHPDDRELVVRDRNRKAPQGFDVEFRIVRPDGEVRHLEVRFTLIRYMGRIVQVGSARDVISDFTGGQDQMDFTAMGMSFSGASGFSNTAGEMIALASGGDTILAGDIDGDGVADFEVMLLGVTSVTGAMFV